MVNFRKILVMIALCVVLASAGLFAQAMAEVIEVEPAVPAIQLAADYHIVGYDYIFALDGNEVTFKFVDAVGKDEIPVIAKALMAVLPKAVSFENPTFGCIKIKCETNLTKDQFDLFVEDAKKLIYDTIF
ncbi:MAG: hypothetical protein PHI83_07990 [Sphaerochaetaceae bacterium]|jgi:hypothetical protein|nr:hypothetical protein [Sphaerochaetaceae bacterium]